MKQENFPFRKKYEEFYKLYEILSPAYSEGRYDMMSESTKSSKDWRSLTIETMDRVFAPLEKSEYERSYALGKTKIMMNTEIKEVLECSRQKAAAVYDKHSGYLKRCYAVTTAQKELFRKKMCLKKIQRAMRASYYRLQRSRAEAV